MTTTTRSRSFGESERGIAARSHAAPQLRPSGAAHMTSLAAGRDRRRPMAAPLGGETSSAVSRVQCRPVEGGHESTKNDARPLQHAGP